MERVLESRWELWMAEEQLGLQREREMERGIQSAWLMDWLAEETQLEFQK